MLLTDITFLIVFGVGILAFTTMFFIWRGIFWLAWIAAVFWLLFGLWCRTALNENFMFMREIGVIFIGIAIAMFFAPFWIRARTSELEVAPPEDIDIWAGMADEHRARVDKHKRLRKSNRGDDE